MVMGSVIMPFSARLTRRTSSAWASMLMFLCSTPIPPSWAMAMAMADSVTVSMAALTKGMLSLMLRVKWVVVSTSLGKTSE